MRKNNWRTVCLNTKTARLYAKSKVEWETSNGTLMSGKIKQIFSDRATVEGDKGLIYLVEVSKLRKVFNGL